MCQYTSKTFAFFVEMLILKSQANHHQLELGRMCLVQTSCSCNTLHIQCLLMLGKALAVLELRRFLIPH